MVAKAKICEKQFPRRKQRPSLSSITKQINFLLTSRAQLCDADAAIPVPLARESQMLDLAAQMKAVAMLSRESNIDRFLVINKRHTAAAVRNEALTSNAGNYSIDCN